MQHKFTRTFHDCTQDQRDLLLSKIAELTKISNDLYSMGEVVAFDKVGDAIAHLRFQVDFLTDKTCRVLDEDFMRGIAA